MYGVLVLGNLKAVWFCNSFFMLGYDARQDNGDGEDQQMTEEKRPQKRGSGFLRLFERGVDTATRNNVTAYGYSVSITAAFALLQASRSDTGVLEVFVFAVGAVIAFALIAAAASGFFREELEDQPSNVKALAGARCPSSRWALRSGWHTLSEYLYKAR